MIGAIICHIYGLYFFGYQIIETEALKPAMTAYLLAISLMPQPILRILLQQLITYIYIAIPM